MLFMSVYSVSGKGFLFYNRNQKEKGEDAMSVVDNIRFTFLYIEFYSMGKTWVYPETYIPYNIFRYVSKGKAVFCIDDEVVTVEENQIVYIPSGCRMSCHVLSESFEFYSIRFTTSVFYEGEDVLKEYYGIPRVQENQGEDMYFKEIYQWVKKESAVKKCFVRGYLDLLIGSLAMRGSMERAGRENFLEQKETKELQHKEIKKKEQIDPRIQMVADWIAVILNEHNRLPENHFPAVSLRYCLRSVCSSYTIPFLFPCFFSVLIRSKAERRLKFPDEIICILIAALISNVINIIIAYQQSSGRRSKANFPYIFHGRFSHIDLKQAAESLFAKLRHFRHFLSILKKLPGNDFPAIYCVHLVSQQSIV